MPASYCSPVHLGYLADPLVQPTGRCDDPGLNLTPTERFAIDPHPIVSGREGMRA